MRVNYGKSVHGKKEINAVLQVLNSSTQMGSRVDEFEKKISKLFNKKYGIMTNSGSSALFLVFKSLNLKKGSEVITPALTFGTTVSSILENGLVPVFVDVKDQTFCIDEEQIEKKITKKTKAILAPDLIGNICHWNKIQKITKKYNLITIQDSADALGSELNKKNVGRYADHSITSFYGSHIINGAGNGGMLCTSNSLVNSKSKLLRSWGRSSSLYKDSEAIENRFDIKIDGLQYDKKFIFSEIGYQLEPSELSAAFALVQLEKLNKNLILRQRNFKKHYEFLKKYNDYFELPIENPNCKTGWLAFPITLREGLKFNRTDMQIYLEKNNIQTRTVFTGNILRQPAFKFLSKRNNPNEFINADKVMRYSLLIACHHGLNIKQINYLHQNIKNFIEKYTS